MSNIIHQELFNPSNNKSARFLTLKALIIL